MFSSPLGWVLLGILQLALGTYFTISFNQYFEIFNHNQSLATSIGVTQFICEGVFGLASLLILFTVPIVAMNLVSDEKKKQTLTFLISAPISMTEIIFGKFIGVITFFSLLILVMVTMVSVLNLWTDIDTGYLFANALGLWLLIACACSIGLFYSCYTAQPILAGFFTFITLMILILLDKFLSIRFENIIQHISIMQHYRNFSEGMIQTYDFIYFILLTTFFLLLAIRKLNAIRLYG